MAEVGLAAGSLAIASYEVIRIGRKLRQIILDSRNYIDDAAKLRIRLEASLTKYDAMHRILWAGGTEICLFNCLDDRAQLSVKDAIETLTTRVASDCGALEGKYSVGNMSQDLHENKHTLQRAQTIAVDSAQDQGRRTALLWAVAGKRRVARVVEDFSIWNEIIYDHVRIYLLERENQERIGSLRIQAIEKSPEGQTSGLSSDIKLNRITHTAPESSDLAAAAQNLHIDQHAIEDKGIAAHLQVGFFQNRVVLLEQTEELLSPSHSASVASPMHAGRAA